MAVKKAESGELVIHSLKRGGLTLRMVGTTPLYFNAMSVKAKRDLLVGSQKKTAAQKREIKHDPEQEFRNSIYKMPDGPTLLAFPAPGVKGAMATAALETAGVTKSSVNRLIFLPQERISVWGRPYLKMDVVRSADINKTPDVRSRAYLPKWAAEFEVAYVTPTLSAASIQALVINAGLICGIGDFRQEKGKGANGTFRLVNDDDPEWLELQSEGREVQEAAMGAPEPADMDTAELLDFLRDERVRRAA